MSGIFLLFRPSGIPESTKRIFKSNLAERVSRMANQQVDIFEEDHIVGSSSHHGVLPCGGSAHDKNGSAFVTGSCWIGSHTKKLSTPRQILNDFTGIPNVERFPFHGSFALAYFDKINNQITVESDRWGVYPIYYRLFDDGIAVSTAIKILVGFGEEKENKEAISELLTLGYIARPHTLINDIQILPANSRLTFGRNGLKIFQFPGTVYSRNRPFDNSGIDEYDSLIKDYFSRFEGCSQNFSISMSGGLDSRLVGLAAQRNHYPLSAFTIGEKNSIETKMAGDVCAMLKIPIKTHEVDGSTFPTWFGKAVWFTEGRALPSHLHYLGAQFSGDVPPGPQLSGLVGEAVLGGHFDNPDLFEAGHGEIRQACRKLVTSSLYYPGDSQPDVLQKSLIDRVPGLEDRIAENIINDMDFHGTYSDYLNFKTQLKGNSYMNPCIFSQIIPWSDVINPFLDPEAFDLCASFSLEGIAARSGQIKWGLRHFPDIAKLPRLKAGVVIDIHDSDPLAYNRGLAKNMRKVRLARYLCRLSGGRINLPMTRSFPHYGSWYRKWANVRNYVDGILLSEQTLDRGLFHREGMKRLLNDLRVGRNVWDAVGSCLMLEIFLRQFIDGTDLPEDIVTPLGFESHTK